jgi:hypothetical protein
MRKYPGRRPPQSPRPVYWTPAMAPEKKGRALQNDRVFRRLQDAAARNVREQNGLPPLERPLTRPYPPDFLNPSLPHP